jgi:hypothetical protein
VRASLDVSSGLDFKRPDLDSKLWQSTREIQERNMKKTTLALGLMAAVSGSLWAQEGAVPKGIPHLDHVFVIMMENHSWSSISGSSSAPR